MFTQPSVPSRKILTRYVAPFGLTALSRPRKPGQPVGSLWVGGERDFGIVLFVSALDAEIYRLHARTIGEEWVRHPFETTDFQQTVEHLGQAWTHLAVGFNANTGRQLRRGPQGSLALLTFRARFRPLEEPAWPVTFRFRPRMFEEIEKQWTRVSGTDHAQGVSRINRLGATQAGAVELGELAERALKATRLGAVGESRRDQTGWALFSPEAGTWCYGLGQQHLH
jgi:hypothetical protein